ncbi:MAG TPA: neutral/alkaline non-lysosomal ceramidase N-terminal domain-containing protein [Myxococcota bacterium]|nr:neutral/alkaline non-lysosomal ceramidase N-terminal domain-containing protein [Myxococcota bacterium]
MSRDPVRARRAPGRGAWRGLAVALLLCARGVHADELRVGFGTKPLPARVGEPMGGYGGLGTRRAEGVLDPPEARALVLEQGELRVAIVVLDVVIARPNVRDRVLETSHSLGVDLLMLVATHTHSGPGGYLPGWLPARMTAGEYDPEMPARLASAAIEALERAVADLAPARLASAVVPLHLARNRRFADGAADERLALLRADFADGRAPVLLFEYGAHATLLSPGNVELSADWPGAARAALGDAHWRAIFVPGPLGDQEPVVELGAFASVEHEREVMKAFGQTMAKSVDAAARALEPGADAEPKLTALERWVDTPPAQFRRFCSLWWISPFAGSSLEAFVSKRVPFQVLRAGDAELVALPAEPIAAVGAELRAAVPSGRKRFVVAHANDWLGYVVDEPTYARGGYEACLDLFGPGTGAWLVDSAAETLRQLDARGAGSGP